MEISAFEDKESTFFETYESHYSMTQFHVPEEANREWRKCWQLASD
jgi:hypothetical protein